MNICKIYIVLVLALGFNLSAQNKYTKKADKYFAKFEYVKAIEHYSRIVQHDAADDYVYSRLAECYFEVNDTGQAEHFYSKIENTSIDKENLFNYVEALRANGNVDESNKLFKTFSEKYPDDFRSVNYNANHDLKNN